MERDVGERTAEELPVLTEALPILAEELRSGMALISSRARC